MSIRRAQSLRVSFGVLNLTHRDSHAAPSPLVPGERYRVRLQLNDCGATFPAGHRIRLALSTAYWPMVWPAPHDATVTILGRCARPAGTAAASGGCVAADLADGGDGDAGPRHARL